MLKTRPPLTCHGCIGNFKSLYVVSVDNLDCLTPMLLVANLTKAK